MSEIKYGGHTAEELKVARAAGTKGKWDHSGGHETHCIHVEGDGSNAICPDDVLIAFGYAGKEYRPGVAKYADARLIVLAVNALPDLLARIQQLEAELQAAKAHSVMLREQRIQQAGSQPIWVCFHCDFSTSDRVEAAAHFGEREVHFRPLCWCWGHLDDQERLEQFQGAAVRIKELEAQNGRLREALEELKTALCYPDEKLWVTLDGDGWIPVCQLPF